MDPPIFCTLLVRASYSRKKNQPLVGGASSSSSESSSFFAFVSPAAADVSPARVERSFTMSWGRFIARSTSSGCSGTRLCNMFLFADESPTVVAPDPPAGPPPPRRVSPLECIFSRRRLRSSARSSGFTIPSDLSLSTHYPPIILIRIRPARPRRGEGGRCHERTIKRRVGSEDEKRKWPVELQKPTLLPLSSLGRARSGGGESAPPGSRASRESQFVGISRVS